MVLCRAADHRRRQGTVRREGRPGAAGLSDAAVEGQVKKTGNPRFAYDGYRRLIDMFGSTAMDVEHKEFEHELTRLKEERGVKLDTELSADDLKELVKRYKAVYKSHVGKDFPQAPA